MKIFSPAKINIGLKVGPRRIADGYHYISSIFVPISFGDELEIDVSHEDRFSSENEIPENLGSKEFDRIREGGDLSANLLWQALEKTRHFRSRALSVHLRKRIPLGSGLGGGSSNAGTLFKYILEHCLLEETSLNSASEFIFKSALELGTDIPFFLNPRPTLVSGIGDILSPLSVGKGLGLLALGAVSLPTSEAYAALKRPLQGGAPPKKLRELEEISIRRALEGSDWSGLSALQNDFEGPVFSTHEALRQVKIEFLGEEGADYALMSGSGSSIYALFGADPSGKERLCKLKKRMEAKFPSFSFLSFRF